MYASYSRERYKQALDGTKRLSNFHPSSSFHPSRTLTQQYPPTLTQQIPNGFDDPLHCYPILGTQNALARVRRLRELGRQILHARGFQGWVPVSPVLGYGAE
jgi:hypothetical protein